MSRLLFCLEKLSKKTVRSVYFPISYPTGGGLYHARLSTRLTSCRFFVVIRLCPLRSNEQQYRSVVHEEVALVLLCAMCLTGPRSVSKSILFFTIAIIMNNQRLYRFRIASPISYFVNYVKRSSI